MDKKKTPPPSVIDPSLSSSRVKSVAREAREAFASLLEQRTSFFSALKNSEKTEAPVSETKKLTTAQKTRMLIDAVYDGDMGAVKSALDLGASPNAVGARKMTSLAAAYATSNPEIFELLLSKGARPSDQLWWHARWGETPETSMNRYLCTNLMLDQGHTPPADVTEELLRFHGQGNSALLAFAERGHVQLSGDDGCTLAFRIIEQGLDPSLLERAKGFIVSGPWQERLSFPSGYKGMGNGAMLLHNALSADRVDLFLFLLDVGYLEGVAASKWKFAMNSSESISLVTHAMRNGAGRILQTLARVPEFSEQFTNPTELESSAILFSNEKNGYQHSRAFSHEAWRGFWEGGGDPYLKDMDGDTLLHRLVATNGRPSMALVEDLLRRAPGIEQCKNKHGKTPFDIADDIRVTKNPNHYDSSIHKNFIDKLRVSIDEIRIRKEVGRAPAKTKKKSARRGL